MKPVLGKHSVVSLIWKSNYKKKTNLENIDEPSNFATTKKKSIMHLYRTLLLDL